MSAPRWLRRLAVPVTSLLVGALVLWLVQRGLLDSAFGSEGVVSFRGRDFRLEEPELLLLVAALPLLWISAFFSRTGLPWSQRLLSAVLRTLLLGSLIFGLGGLTETRKSDEICAVALIDVSESMGDEALERAIERVRALRDARPNEDQLRLLAFARSVREVPLTERDESGTERLVELNVQRLRDAISDRTGTDVAGALRAAAAWTQGDCLPRYHLLSDGIETVGDAGAEVAGLSRRMARLSTEPIDVEPPRDVAVTQVEIPDGVRVGEPFVVRVGLDATRAARGTLRLYQGDTLNGLGGVREIEIEPGQSAHTFESVVRVKGEVVYRAEFEAAEPEHFAQNNSFSAAIDVPGPPRVLLVDRQPAQATYLAQALVAQQFDVDVRIPGAFPRSREELAAFEFVILSDVPRSDFARGAEDLLIRYVQGGGGLLYAGGEAAYGPGGWQGAPLSRILPVGMDAEKDREIPGVAMALVIDRSGSMTGLPLQMAKEACNATLSVLEGSDLIEIIAFDSTPTRYVKMQPARFRARIQSSVLRIQPGGGTELFNSLDMAYQDLAAIEARKKHIVMLTDGNASSDGLYEVSATAFSEGITITTVGLGGGANQELLRMIAEAGGGRFHAADDPSSLPRIFTRETELVSKEAAVEDWFPVVVAARPGFTRGLALGSAPYLRGYTRTQMGLPPSELILATDTGDPLLARRRVGLGWTIAWTSDLKSRWAIDWLRWGQFGKFLGQLIRAHQLTDDTEIRPMEVRLSGRDLIASLDAFDAEENFDSDLQSRLLVRPAGAPAEESLETRFQLVAPGHYEARLRLPEVGAYSVKAVHQRLLEGGKTEPAGMSFASVTLPYPDEYVALEPRPELLRRWAELGGGAVSPTPAQLFDPGEQRIERREARQGYSLLLALALLLLDLLVRRVRLFDRPARTALSG